MSSLALGFCACDDDEVIEGIPQTNEQLPQMVADGVVSVPVINANQSIDLEALKNAKEINVIDIAEVTNLPIDNELKVDMLFADNAELNNAQIIPVQLKKDESGNVLDKGFVYTESWNEAFKAVFGKFPETHQGFIGFNIYTVKGTSEVYLGRLGNTIAISVTPMTPPFIDTVYYLMINGEKRAEFEHTGGNIYDNPNFKASAKVDLYGGDMDLVTFECPWYIVAKTYAETQDASVARMVFAPESPELTEGKLLTNTGVNDIPASGTLILDGALNFTFNAETLEFKIKEAAYLYTPGASNGWNAGNSQWLYFNKDSKIYEGYAYLSGEFKFADTTDWSGTNYGNSGEDGLLTTDGTAGNLKTDEGLYWCNVSVEELTYKLIPVTTIGLVGDATPGGWNTDTDLTSDNYLVWKGTIELKASGKFKFRANDEWDINLGGDIADLTQGGSDIASPGDGTYEVVLDLSKLPYTATLTKK